MILYFWSNYSDLTRRISPKWWFSKGNPRNFQGNLGRGEIVFHLARYTHPIPYLPYLNLIMIFVFLFTYPPPPLKTNISPEKIGWLEDDLLECFQSFTQVIKEEVVDCLQQHTKMLQDLKLSLDKLRLSPVVSWQSKVPPQEIAGLIKGRLTIGFP